MGCFSFGLDLFAIRQDANVKGGKHRCIDWRLSVHIVLLGDRERRLTPEFPGSIDIPSRSQDDKVDTIAQIRYVILLQLDPGVARIQVGGFGSFQHETFLAGLGGLSKYTLEYLI